MHDANLCNKFVITHLSNRHHKNSTASVLQASYTKTECDALSQKPRKKTVWNRPKKTCYDGGCGQVHLMQINNIMKAP